ncbi:MAG: TerC family protein [Gammaproteobacteria bacterium]
MNIFLDITLSLITLTILEVVLGIDNLVFLAIISQKLPKNKQRKARQIGLTLAWVTRLLLLASAVWITKLTHPLFSLFGMDFSGRDLFLFSGGLFLMAKATQEIHAEVDPAPPTETVIKKQMQFSMVIAQIAILDVVFSLDSVLTAIGLTTRFWLMAIAITIAIIAMLFASEPLSHFVERHPTIKMLALSFLILIGMVLIADSFESHIPRGYIYFAMGFSLFIEFLNMLRRKRVS